MRPRLSYLWALSVLGASLVPLGLAGWFALDVIERSTLEGVRASQKELALSGEAVLVAHIESGKRKLAALARLLEFSADPREYTPKLDRMLDPQDIFLEVGCWSALPEPRVQVQSQQAAFTDNVRNSRRAFDPGLSQSVMALSNSDPEISEPMRGRTYVASTIEGAGDVAGLTASVPGPDGSVIVGVIDLSGVRDVFDRFTGESQRAISIVDGQGNTILASRASANADPSIESVLPASHADWKIVVREPRSIALAPLAEARRGVLIGLAIACVLSIVLALAFGAIVLRPLRSLAKTAERLGAGDWKARSGIAREDEVGQLARSFDRMAADLEELDRLKSEFVAHVSHELRTPLTSAKMTLANVEEGIAGPAALARVRADLDRLVRLVNELLDLARVEAGIQLDVRPSKLDQVVREAVETLKPLARVPVDVRGDGDTLPIDPARVHQIVVNLVDNALKHARSRVDVAITGREVRVTDDGPGVPEALRERVFEGFVRLESSASTQGFGLGLAIARKLAGLHGATLVCEGNAFVLRFPA